MVYHRIYSGPLLFHIVLCDFFFFLFLMTIVLTIFADDTALHECEPTLNEVMNNLEITTEDFFEWFSISNLKPNASKSHLFSFLCQSVSENIRGSITESSICEKLLGRHIDSNFSFEYHIIIQIEFVVKRVQTFMHSLRLQNAVPKIKNVCYSNLSSFHNSTLVQ